MKKSTKIKTKKKVNSWVIQFLLIFLSVTAAFSLSEWSDKRKMKKHEKIILQEIYNGIQEDFSNIEKGIGLINTDLYGLKKLKYLTLNPTTPPDSAVLYVVMTTSADLGHISKAGYESLKSSGLLNISNDSLRIMISGLYEDTYVYIENRFNTDLAQRMQEDLFEILKALIIYDDVGNVIGSKSFSILSERERELLLGAITYKEGVLNIKIGNYEKARSRAQGVSDAIEEYLNIKN